MTLLEAFSELVEAAEQHILDYDGYFGMEPPPEYVEAVKVVKEWMDGLVLYGTGEGAPVGVLYGKDLTIPSA